MPKRRQPSTRVVNAAQLLDPHLLHLLQQAFRGQRTLLYLPPPDRPVPAHLRAVAALTEAGHSAATIAAQLGITPRHVHRLRQTIRENPTVLEAPRDRRPRSAPSSAAVPSHTPRCVNAARVLSATTVQQLRRAVRRARVLLYVPAALHPVPARLQAVATRTDAGQSATAIAQELGMTVRQVHRLRQQRRDQPERLQPRPVQPIPAPAPPTTAATRPAVARRAASRPSSACPTPSSPPTPSAPPPDVPVFPRARQIPAYGSPLPSDQIPTVLDLRGKPSDDVIVVRGGKGLLPSSDEEA